ncbi:SAM-dependent methyltransferase [Luteipulveratus mongoliensis]|uniref:SAM-dependent methyltransferase n=2 Tax=Luteipulveratus mongoliensis TaxID=571913 RepID=A0A0K1JR23_9MICO|nr:SAM-dependent methyltransferase [Luteipulveratus mongoliensis]
MTVDVEGVAHGGHCVARHEGQVLFVRHALPGEQVVVEVTSGTTGSTFLRADAVEVLRASPERREPPCPYAGPGQCGGCDWQHTSVEFSRELKARVVREQLQRLARLDVPVEVEPVPGDQDGLRWRTRVELAVGGAGRAGMRKHRSHDVMPVDDCLIAVQEIADSGVLQRSWPAGTSGVDVARSSTGELAVVPLPVSGDVPTLTELVTIDGREACLEVSARGFWQVHPGAAETFADTVLEALDLREGEHVLDLYCGVGLFAEAVAEVVGESGRVLGVEGDRTGAAEGVHNLRHRPNAAIEEGDVLARLSDDTIARTLGGRVDAVVLDPPRTGAGREVMQQVLGQDPRVVVYVACDPAALARDVAYAAESGYGLVGLRAFDAFPMTHHVECVAILEPDAAG